MMAPRELLAQAATRLAAAGVGSPRVDAELLLAHLLGAPRSRLRLIDRVDGRHAAAFEALLARRAAREPLQHLVGSAGFRHIELAVGPGVFIPRPETELLVDAVLPALLAAEAPVVIDLCSGSGALALAIADEVPQARVHAVERDARALEWLRRNAADARVEVLQGDVSDPDLLADLAGRADVVVSNPPYVPSTTEVDPEVRADPAAAVFAGPDGLALMPAVIARAADLLRTGGVLAIEHDDSHAVALPALLIADGRWSQVLDHRDLSGRPRFVTAIRAAPAR